MPNQYCVRTVLANREANIFILGTRSAAVPVRKEVETALQSSDAEVCIDFRGVSVTQSFCDELIGVLLLRFGPSILDRIAFSNCSEEVRAAIRLVSSSRARDYRELIASA